MKKLILTILLIALPTSMFAIGGLGLSVGSGTFTVDPSSSDLTVGEVKVGQIDHHGFENGFAIGGYLYLDIIPFIDIDVEVNAMGNLYDFSFYNNAMVDAGVAEPDTFSFGFASANSYFTVQKKIFGLGIPFLAKAKLYAGAGINQHASTPFINQEMMESVVLDADGNPDLENGEFDSDALKDYLKDNNNETTGLHVQAGIHFRLLTFDAMAYYRYTIAEEVVPGNNGFSSVNLRLGLGI